MEDDEYTEHHTKLHERIRISAEVAEEQSARRKQKVPRLGLASSLGMTEP